MRQLKRRLPLVAFVLVALVGWIGAAMLWTTAVRTDELRFAAVADEATNRIRERMRLHLLLIEATAAIIEAQGDTLSARRFAEYFDNLNLQERHPGIAGLGFAPLLRPQDTAALTRRFEANYGRPIEVWPVSDAARIVPVALLGSPDLETPPAIGYDMYSEPVRRAAIDAAIEARGPRATTATSLATDAAPAPSFIVYAPIYAGSFGIPRRTGPLAEPTGFAIGAFRIAELLGSALHVAPYLTVSMTVTDTDTDAPEVPLYAYGAAAATGPWTPAAQTRSVELAGQAWALAFRPTAGFHLASGRPFALAFMALTTALAAAAAVALREQARAQTAAEVLVSASQRSVAEKDMLLNEMKHRIKNVIARILAIARQTAAQSDDLTTFSGSFAQRLQAMAAAQDMLTRSASARADLAELLSRELFQVFGEDFEPSQLQGVSVELDATRTQALGLVFHELATNALKYGGADGRPPSIDVRWRVKPAGGAEQLKLHWQESGGRISPPEHVGFGTRLIDATLRRELDGEVERDWRPEGLNLRLRIPLSG